MSHTPRLPTIAHSAGLPAMGIGTYELRGSECVTIVRAALEMGIRLIDTAACYRNEELVGEGICDSGVPRECIFVVVKIAMKSMRTVDTLRAGIEDSLRKLRIGYADCLLMHWPGCGGVRANDAAAQAAARRRCWEVMGEFYRAGRARRIGVSNFGVGHFTDLPHIPPRPRALSREEPECTVWDKSRAERTPSPDRTHSGRSHNTGKPDDERRDCYDTHSKNDKKMHSHCCDKHEVVKDENDRVAGETVPSHVVPYLNQIELHPLCVQSEVVSYCRARGILLQQYSPLGKGDDRLLRCGELCRIQANYFPDYSVVDLLLMWGLAQGFCTLVRTRSVAHLRANWDVARHFFCGQTSSPSGSSNAGPGDDGVGEETCGRTVGDACGREGRGGDDAGHRPARAPLTSEQRRIIFNLRELMHVSEDVHLCWDSATVA